MSKHILYEYTDTALFQGFQVAEYEQLDRISLGMYFGNDPAGNYKLTLSTVDGELTSKTYTMEEIIALGEWNPGEYHIGYVMFQFDKYINLHPDIDYTITLETSGYAYADDSFMGVMIPHENKLNESSNFNSVLGYKLYNIIDGGNMRIIDFFDGQSSATEPLFSEINVSVTGYYYLGDETTDGSWRWYVSSGNLVFEKRIAGVWVLSENSEVLA